MRKEIIYTMNTAYRGEYSIKGFQLRNRRKGSMYHGSYAWK